MQRNTRKTFENHLPTRRRTKWDSVEQHIEFLRHFAAYKHAGKFVKGKSVLEIGCGTGYGADYLSRFASSVIAIDISKACIASCHTQHKKEKLTFLRASGLNIPLKDSSIDVVLSFQVIEHIEPKKVGHFLLETKRLLKDEGAFLVSTPNKELRLLPFQKPWNPEHKKEYNYRDFKTTLSDIFEEVKIYGLKGSNEIQLIERKRVKQKPFRVYIIKPLIPFVEKVFPSIIISQFRKMRRPDGSQGKRCSVILNKMTKKIGIKDFKLLSHRPRDCLDFYGICQKVTNKKFKSSI